MSTDLLKIAKKAKENPTIRFTSLAHLLTPAFLKETWTEMNRRGAAGADGETIDEFATNLDQRIADLCSRVKARQYKAPPVRRVEIPKNGGKGTRPLGIPTVEDRLLQRAVSRILGAIYDQDFLDCSHGYRPGRNPHQALKALHGHIKAGKVRYVFEADIRGYFNNLNHDWLRKMAEHRVADPLILGLIGKWLNAGVMQHGVVVRSESGSPQGGPISPCLANLYLHHVLDLWFERRMKRAFSGQAYLTRFVDDFVVCFQNYADVKEFERALAERMRKFGLELAPEKTRTMTFGRFAHEKLKRPETFDFLGFKHVCGRSRRDRKFALIRIPSQKSCRKFIDKVKEWLWRHSSSHRREHQFQLSMMLKGFYQYFSLHHCTLKLQWVRREVQRIWIRILRRRSQRHKIHWSYLENSPWFALPYPPRTLHPTV